jgi:beta-phosphoglucomutase
VLRAILLDFNGVLVDDEPIHFELMQKVLLEEGFILERETYFSNFLGVTDRACLQGFLRLQGEDPPPERVSRLLARKAAYYQQRMWRAGFPVVPGAVELVEQAAARGFMLGVVSGALRDEIDAALDQMDIARHFKTIVSAEDVEASKPSPEGYRKGLSGLNGSPPLPARLLHPHEVLAIEDSPAGIEAANAAGLPTLGLGHPYAGDRLGHAERVVPTLVGLGIEGINALFGREP